MDERDFYRLPVREVMERDPPLVARDAALAEVARVVNERQHAWVVESKEDRKLRGIITQKDLVDIISPIPSKSYTTGTIRLKCLHHAELNKAEDFMSKPIVCCRPETTMEQALCLMAERRIRRLAVAEDDEIIGELNLGIVIGNYLKKTQREGAQGDRSI